MTREREELKQILEDRKRAGSASGLDVIKELTAYDAARATRAMPIYALISTALAAVSAVASAAAAYFAYVALHVPPH
jgi:hypothetical protein